MSVKQTDKLVTLPPPPTLEEICKGIATLDAILSADWEYRYYSFNAAWADGQRMASMRNGSGDDWFIVFTDSGTFMKSFWHEYERENVHAIYASVPSSLAAQVSEPAFGMTDVTFGGFHNGSEWKLRGNAKPLAKDLAILSGDPAAYRAFALEYFEAEVPLDAIAHVVAGKPLTAELVARMGGERTLGELASDLAEIAYGV